MDGQIEIPHREMMHSSRDGVMIYIPIFTPQFSTPRPDFPCEIRGIGNNIPKPQTLSYSSTFLSLGTFSFIVHMSTRGI